MSNYNPRNDVTLLLPCDEHPDRSGKLTVDLPSLGIKLYKCEECSRRLSDGLRHVSTYLEPWEKDLLTGNNGGWYVHTDAAGNRTIKEKT